MTDKEIIKVLECCSKNDCDNCVHSKVKPQNQNCNVFICKNVLDLIKRQKAEIERLQKQLVFEIESAYDRGAKAAIKEFAKRLKKKLFL